MAPRLAGAPCIAQRRGATHRPHFGETAKRRNELIGEVAMESTTRCTWAAVQDLEGTLAEQTHFGLRAWDHRDRRPHCFPTPKLPTPWSRTKPRSIIESTIWFHRTSPPSEFRRQAPRAATSTRRHAGGRALDVAVQPRVGHDRCGRTPSEIWRNNFRRKRQ
jgi:hypothetical protein